MKATEKIFHKAVTMAELSQRYMLTPTILGIILSAPSCMGPVPPHPPQTGN